MVNLIIILGIIALSVIVILFVLPMPIGIEYCDAKFLDNTFYELQKKCWMDFQSMR